MEMRQELRAFTIAFWMRASDTQLDPGTPISYAVQVGGMIIILILLVFIPLPGLLSWTAGWFAQLDGYHTVVREVDGLNPGRTNTQGVKKNYLRKNSFLCYDFVVF